jgi:acyl-coenzyme A synthetase/AMP-(fatty) acid ligase/acyl carrier protein
MYTSGSTGKPKGVMVENGNVLSFFDGMDEVIGREPGVWLAVTSVCFDISVLELLWTLSRGFTVVVHDDEGSNPIGEEIASHGVTHLQMTPSLARMLELDPRAFAELGCLKKLLLGGEVVPASLIHRVRRVYAGEIYNMYGPTETTIWSTAGRVGEVGKSVPIGRPIAGTEVSLLDTELKPIPSGEVGELFIGGAGVTRGYWNRPDLTAERFVTVPMISTERMYRTGDLGRLLPDGSIEFLGRADYQVKLRGHRIELGEIEAVLERCRGVRQAVVVLREDREGDKRLVAYLVGEPSQGPGAEELRRVLKSTVPDYMVPSFFVFLAELPLTQNKKIDRKALLAMPAPDAGARNDVRLECEASSEMERIVARAWQEALGLSCVGLDDNFFDLGAHSLTVAEVHASLQAALSREMPLVDLFQFSTVRALAAHLAGVESIAMRNELSERAQRRRLARHS